MKNNIEQKNIPQGWFETTLEKECDVLKGQGLSKGKLLDDGKNECILYGELYTKYGEIVDTIKSHTDSEEGVRSKKEDILIPASTTTIAKDLAIATALNKDGVFLGGDINILRKKKNSYDANFLAYYLTHYKNKELAKLAQGITIIHLYGKDFKKLSICIPKKIDEQQKIAEILGVVDEDIAKTQEVIEATEKLKRGLMQKLFTRGIGHKKFKKTKFGKIPEGWEVINLSKIFKLSSGKGLSRSKFIPGKFSVYGGNGISGVHNEYLLEKPTIIIGRVGEYCGSVHITKPYSWITDNALYVEKYLRDIEQYYLYYLLYFINLNQYAKVGGQPSISQDTVGTIQIGLPNKGEQKEIAEIISAVDEKISINKKLKNKLTLLKKGLAQDLLSGKVRV